MHPPTSVLFIITMMGAMQSSEGVKYHVEFTLAAARLSNWDRELARGIDNSNTTKEARDSIGPYGDHYCKVWTISGVRPEEYLGTTEVAPNDNQPWWHHEFNTYFIFDFSRTLRFEVWDDDPGLDDYVGGTKKEIKELCEQNSMLVTIQHAEVDIVLRSSASSNAGTLIISHRITHIDLEHNRAENGSDHNSSHKNHMALPYNILVVLVLTLSYFLQLQPKLT